MLFRAGKPLRDAVSVSERLSIVVLLPLGVRGFCGVCVAVAAFGSGAAPTRCGWGPLFGRS